jgi:hypothetical protein
VGGGGVGVVGCVGTCAEAAGASTSDAARRGRAVFMVMRRILS